MAETEIHDSITADGLAGKMREWKVEEKIPPSYGKRIIIYRKRFITNIGKSGKKFIYNGVYDDEWKVQVYGSDGYERWERFTKRAAVENYINKIRRMKFSEGIFIENKNHIKKPIKTKKKITRSDTSDNITKFIREVWSMKN